MSKFVTFVGKKDHYNRIGPLTHRIAILTNELVTELVL